MTEERIQKVLARLGLGSRRAIEDWIEDGRVKINGAMARLGDRVTGRDEVRIDGRPVSANAPRSEMDGQRLPPQSQYRGQTRSPQYGGGQSQSSQYGNGQNRTSQYNGQNRASQYGGQTQSQYGNSQPRSPQYGGGQQGNVDHGHRKHAPYRPEREPKITNKNVGADNNEERQELGYRRCSRRVLVYYKPEGEVCTRTDPEGRPTVFGQLPPLENERWVVIGRLDLATTGLLLFTTDGDLANSLMHPSSQVQREYAVRVYGDVTQAVLDNLLSGVLLEDGLAKFSQIVDAGGDGKNHWYHVTIAEGKNREVRRMFESQGLQVSRLIRIRFGHVQLPRDWKPGQFEELSAAEVEQLSQQVGIKLKRRTGLYGRSKVRAEKLMPPPAVPSAASDDKGIDGDKNNRRGGYLRRRRYDPSAD